MQKNAIGQLIEQYTSLFGYPATNILLTYMPYGSTFS